MRPAARDTQRVEAVAMGAVADAERRLGHRPRDVSRDKVGYDIESAAPDGTLRLLEVKGRVEGADTLTVTDLRLAATPHDGKEEDFQLFLALLDGDRFAGRFREGVHTVDTQDLMRRLVKEQLYRFDGTPLFPERRAYTAAYTLSEGERAL